MLMAQETGERPETAARWGKTVLLIGFLVLAVLPAMTAEWISEDVSSCDFVCGETPCRMTWTGSKTGWRLKSAKADGAFADQGAVQRLAVFMDEKSPSADLPFKLVGKNGRKVCQASDGTKVAIETNGSFRVFSAAGKVVTEVQAVLSDGRSTQLVGRLLDAEAVYGGGERMDRLNQRGRTLDIWTRDGYNDSTACYLAIPFFVTTRGGGVFVNQYERMTADFGACEPNVWSVTVRRQDLNAYFYAKGTIPEAVAAQVELAGRPFVPPDWSRGPLICRYNPDFRIFEGRMAGKVDGTMLVGYGVKDIVERHIKMGNVPKAVILEPSGFVDLYTPGGGCGSGEGRRKELQKIVRYLREKDIKVMMYMAMGMAFSRGHPRWRPDEFQVRASIETNGVPCETDTYLIPWVAGGGGNIDLGGKRTCRYAYLDITNPEMWEWFVGLWKELADIGVSGVKIDFCEELPDDGVDYGGVKVHYRWHDPKVFADTSVHHAYPTFFTTRLYREMSVYTKDKGGFAVVYRGGNVGSQRNPFHWAGDQERCFAKLDDHVISMLTLGLSGVPFSTYDMAGYHYDGGYEAVPAGEKIDGVDVFLRKPRTETFENECAIFRRGTEFTAFTPCVQTHGDVRNVYEMDMATQRHYLKYMRIHEALGPYIEKLNREAATTGAPPVRPLVWRWPDDPKTWDVTDAFLLGNVVLVAPVYGRDDARGGIYLPRGDWVKIEGLELPVYVDRTQPEGRSLLTAIKSGLR